MPERRRPRQKPAIDWLNVTVWGGAFLLTIAFWLLAAPILFRAVLALFTAS